MNREDVLKKSESTLVAKKKKPFLGEKKFFLHFGFEVVDTIQDYELLALKFDGNDTPKFNDNARLMKIDDEDFTIYYTNQCPYVEYEIRELTDYSESNNIKLNFIKIDSLEKAKNAPCIIFIDEIDAIALDRTNPNDLREMGRATSAMLKGFDRMNENIILVATTNLYKHFDKALIRRFDSVIDFNRYSKEDLMTISEKMLDRYLVKIRLANRDVRLFRKIMDLMDPIPYPGELKNLIKSAIAFSNPNDGHDYFRRLYYAVCEEKPEDLQKLQQQ